MPSELLKCIICPKKPKFSDISHLLTHVGSKGHLAHLHGLQVRSHQKLDAAHQLGFYNQWYQEHGMAALLSDRLQEKERKRAVKNAANAARMASTPTNVKAEKQKAVKMEVVSSSSLLEQTCTPVRGSRDSSYPVIPSSPPRRTSGGIAEELMSTEAASEVKASPGTPQLKGTQYPGMDLWDAAPEEQRKKRNQKKDSSVLRQLERYSARVVPRETVSSALGNVLKHRHMDDLENDSPVEGEETLRQPTPKRRKQVKPRAPRVKKEKVEKKPKRRPGRPRKVVEMPRKTPEPSATEAEPSTLGLTPAEKLSNNFVGGHLGPKRRRTFAVYQDSSPAFGVDESSDVHPSSYAGVDASQPQFAYPPSLWRKSEPEAYDPFKLIREGFTAYSGLEEVSQGKENSDSFLNAGVPQAHINPLLFQASNNVVPLDGTYGVNRLNPISTNNTDPFQNNNAYVPSKTPLMAALERLRTPKQESFDYGTAHIEAFSTPYRGAVFAP